MTTAATAVNKCGDLVLSFFASREVQKRDSLFAASWPCPCCLTRCRRFAAIFSCPAAIEDVTTTVFTPVHDAASITFCVPCTGTGNNKPGLFWSGNACEKRGKREVNIALGHQGH
jgi:hypothetical protein